ncbi:GAF domain-containing protein [Flavobacterium xinjiangense]|uniref:GAF domain-containing protein n=1 Tax=Flavobacterium xinjiangense TaxID=178356 RepID=A0A1M7IQU8_9FLAO|nr:GAF domain-containing protein [Flavobacterium xinjiangense]SHM43065.1 GAF domain-containing protein [Flavobacterium xinjiangense]
MTHNFFKNSPFQTLISFHKLIETLEEIVEKKLDHKVNYASALIKEIEPFPEFRTGIKNFSLIKKNEKLIKSLLGDLFPTALTNNEIKAITIPFQNFTFNYSERFNKILQDAGGKFDMSIRNFDENQFYIMSCSLILNSYYNQKIEFSKPLFYDIPDANGILKHYRILYNADFIDILPTEKSISLTTEDIELLMDNYDDIDLWKEKFPKESWILKGFAIVVLFDATIESAISKLKSNLLKSETEYSDINKNLETIFRSIFKVADLKVGLIVYNEEDDKFTRPLFNQNEIGSFILFGNELEECNDTIFGSTVETLLKKKKTFAISNINKFSRIPGNEKLGTHLLQQDIKSCILAPVLKNNKLLGIIELVSSTPNELNSVNANNLDLLLPYVVDTLDRYNIELQNQIEAVIQREYTSIHSSVYWKFREEAKKYNQTYNPNKDYIFKEIVFKEVYPLYGQIDIKGSSEHRNETVKEDLKNQLAALINIFENLKENSTLPLLDQRKFEMQSYFDDLDLDLKADTEQQIQNYIQKEINPIITKSTIDNENKALIDKYFADLDDKTQLFYHSRRKFDDAMSIVNKKMTSILDKEQKEAQKIFPHYYERFKTDGVEHNLYIGASISPLQTFDAMYLNNLRLWQLQTLCKMELEHHQIKSVLPYKLEVTSLILVFSSALTIRFRMDEKRFDVDGTYNARYEVVKKRIDKANIKGTEERITQKEKITIVYSHSNEEAEYLKYIKFLQFKKILDPKIEKFDVEELQGVSGLKALRVKVINVGKKALSKKITYQELLNELN